jgi:hypothetical protein
VRVVISRRLRWTGHIARMGIRKWYIVLVVEPLSNLGRPRQRCEDNIKIDLR